MNGVRDSTMRIDSTNYESGNKGMAAVLLLYYHLANCGGFTGDETVYIDPTIFDGFSFLDVEVKDGYEGEINQSLLRQGAIIFLLCDLNDLISQYQDNFLSFDLTKRILKLFEEGRLSAIPETKRLFDLFQKNEAEFNFDEFYSIMRQIFNLYVVEVFNGLARKNRP